MQLPDQSAHRSDLWVPVMLLKALCAEPLSLTEDTVQACDAVLGELARRNDLERMEDQAGLEADTLWIKSRALHRAGDLPGEHAVCQQLIRGYADEPLAAQQVAGAMFNDGVYLRDTNHGDEAVAMWDQFWRRFADGLPDNARMIPITGQLAKSTYLDRTGQLDQALILCAQMRKECQRRSLPTSEVDRAQRRCVNLAQRHDRKTGKLRRLFTSN